MNNQNKDQNWFLTLCHQTKMFEYGKTKGTIFFSPKSAFIWDQIKKILDEEFFKLDVENVYFPSLIPYKLFEKEKQHIEGFKPEVYQVTHAGEKKLNEVLILRPTSEVLFSDYFQKNIKSYRDLPLLLNQWCNVWRLEKNPNPFLRNTEFLWQEGHTVHATEKDALIFCQKMWKVYQDFFEKKLFMQVFKGFKSEAEKFAGAVKTWTLETLLPDGQFLQLATVHFLGKTFSKTFDVKFLDANKTSQHPNQTSWGLSTRTIAGLIKTHLDSKGLKLPFNFLRNPIAIIPIYKKKDSVEKKTLILNYCQEIQKTLKIYRPKLIDISEGNKSFGFLWNELEKNGIPIRIEIGEKEANNQTLTCVLRSDLKKETLQNQELKSQIEKLILKYENSLKEIAFQKHIPLKIFDFSKYQKITKDQAFQMWFCNQIECEKEIKNLTQTVSRCLWIEETFDKCFKCQKKTNISAIFGRSY